MHLTDWQRLRGPIASVLLSSNLLLNSLLLLGQIATNVQLLHFRTTSDEGSFDLASLSLLGLERGLALIHHYLFSASLLGFYCLCCMLLVAFLLQCANVALQRCDVLIQFVDLRAGRCIHVARAQHLGRPHAKSDRGQSGEGRKGRSRSGRD